MSYLIVVLVVKYEMLFKYEVLLANDWLFLSGFVHTVPIYSIISWEFFIVEFRFKEGSGNYIVKNVMSSSRIFLFLCFIIDFS